MTPKRYCLLAGLLFGLFAIIHGVRLAMGWNAVIGGWEVPKIFYIVEFIVIAYFGWMGLRLGSRS